MTFVFINNHRLPRDREINHFWVFLSPPISSPRFSTVWYGAWWFEGICLFAGIGMYPWGCMRMKLEGLPKSMGGARQNKEQSNQDPLGFQSQRSCSVTWAGFILSFIQTPSSTKIGPRELTTMILEITDNDNRSVVLTSLTVVQPWHQAHLGTPRAASSHWLWSSLTVLPSLWLGWLVKGFSCWRQSVKPGRGGWIFRCADTNARLQGSWGIREMWHHKKKNQSCSNLPWGNGHRHTSWQRTQKNCV